MVFETIERHGAFPADGRTGGSRLRTLPEQIAEHLGMAIVEGAYSYGERIVEQKLSQDYGVSRGPVRDALRSLEKRGLVRIYPRRGAYAMPLSLDRLADVFNVRAELLGLAARYMARRRPETGLADLATRTRELAAAVDDPAVDAMGFALANGRLGAVIYRHCGSDYLADLLRDQSNRSIWDFIWRQRPLDFLTPERRQESAALWSAANAAVQAGDDTAAERAIHRIMFSSRDHVIATLAHVRADSIDPARLISAPQLLKRGRPAEAGGLPRGAPAPADQPGGE